MDFNKIKNLVKQTDDKFIFMENGEPEMVIMSFAEYERINSSRDNHNQKKEKIEEQKETNFTQKEEEHGEMNSIAIAEPIGLPVRLEDIRLEDLPI